MIHEPRGFGFTSQWSAEPRASTVKLLTSFCAHLLSEKSFPTRERSQAIVVIKISSSANRCSNATRAISGASRAICMSARRRCLRAQLPSRGVTRLPFALMARHSFVYLEFAFHPQIIVNDRELSSYYERVPLVAHCVGK